MIEAIHGITAPHCVSTWEHHGKPRCGPYKVEQCLQSPRKKKFSVIRGRFVHRAVATFSYDWTRGSGMDIPSCNSFRGGDRQGVIVGVRVGDDDGQRQVWSLVDGSKTSQPAGRSTGPAAWAFFTTICRRNDVDSISPPLSRLPLDLGQQAERGPKLHTPSIHRRGLPPHHHQRVGTR